MRDPLELQPPWPRGGPNDQKKSGKKISAPGSKKVGKSRKKGSKTSQKQPFFDFFSTFFGVTFFRDFFGISGPKGPSDPCKGPRRL